MASPGNIFSFASCFLGAILVVTAAESPISNSQDQLKAGFFVWSGWADPLSILPFHQAALEKEGIIAGMRWVPRFSTATRRTFRPAHTSSIEY